MKRHGLTLIEILIASAIFAVVLVSVYGAFQAGLGSFRRINSAFEELKAARLALKKMDMDFKNAFAYKEGNSFFIGSDSGASFFTLINRYSGGNSGQEAVRVRYEFDPQAKELKRMVFCGINAVQPESEKPSEESVFKAADIKFSFCYSNPAGQVEPYYLWQDSWPVQGKEADLPLAVKVVIDSGFSKTISLLRQ